MINKLFVYVQKLHMYAHQTHAAHRGYALLHTFYFSFVVVEGHGFLVYVAAVLAAATCVAVFKGAEL